ncbi:DNA polymerase III subunit gamma/tau [Hydrogenophaga intermedia]|uniref:DNA polymerase III subunit gamma/tau n=1 Tax=Hydrogenophaga intermedia TaxID=65786 RepID=A0A1L1PM30_HYDIT|nr:DNA polymerase III subunit gamma/tau [Hydrogenophaga intermedia]TMU74430.1 DNA polymerase III subunit gamma/tau [Hydrogenophaga intermedia]CDN88769.1 DNA polymerase III, subunits gamma and tau [Hydrogenophaga intermedia]
MSYVVLARKYRPRNFREMVGQGHVVQALANALTSQRLHHAYLFTGTRGVGKTTVSRILAKSLNCTGPDGQGGITAEPCGVCQACTDIDAGRFVDYTELDAASNRGVDEVQSLLEQAVYKPVQGRFKVFMIDEVHMLTNTAFNAMLKTLEEPPEYLKFVLATTDPQKVPVTVLSRCLQFNLRPMAPETVAEHLQQVLQAEGVTAEPQALRLLSRAARGSMRDALSLTDQAIAFGGGQLMEAPVRQMLGAVDRSHVLRLIDALARADGASVVETVNALRVNGLSAASTLEEMTGLLQRMAVLQSVPDAAATDDDPDTPEIARLAAALPPDETHLLYSLCLHGRTELGLAPDEYAALTMVLLRLLAFKPSGAAEKKTLKPAEARPATAPAPVAAIAPAQAPVRAPVASPNAAPAPRAAAPAPLVAPPAPAAASQRPAPSPSPTPLATAAAAAPAQARQPSEPEPFDGPPIDDAPWPEPDDDLPPWDPEPAPAMSRPAAAPAPAAPVVRIPVRDPGAPGRLDQPRPPSAPLQPTPEGDFWAGVVQQMVDSGAIAALTRELALQSQLVSRDGSRWLLRIERETLAQGSNRDRLTAALHTAGHAVELVLENGAVTDSPARRAAAEAERRQREAEQQILGDPFVQAMMRDFGGTIVPGSLKAIT